jgi:predicted DCC family thiol-disulfide oxidoreductase YuxK
MKRAIPEGKILIRFDGICVLCSSLVRFLLKADRKKKFIFQTQQDFPENESFETVIVSDQQTDYCYFDAILKIGHELGGIYRLIAVFKIVPRGWRRSMYDWVARNRFRWFGKRKVCFLPSEEDKERFI